METVLDLLHAKSQHGIVAVPPEATVWEATALMNDQGIGSVLVVRGRRLAGIFTERDVLRRVVGEGRSPTDTLVGDVMTADVICCGENHALYASEALRFFRMSRRSRRAAARWPGRPRSAPRNGAEAGRP